MDTGIWLNKKKHTNVSIFFLSIGAFLVLKSRLLHKKVVSYSFIKVFHSIYAFTDTSGHKYRLL